MLRQEDVAQLEPACRVVAQRTAELYWEQRNLLQEAFRGCSLESQGNTLDDILAFLYSKIRRMARELLDEQGFFPELPLHRDGSRWVYWAEEIAIEEPGDDEGSPP